jgi:hypothetical protein
MAIVPVVGSILQCVEMLDVEDDTHECVAQIMNMYEECSVLRVVEEILTDDALPTPSGTFVLSAISLMLLCLLIVQHYSNNISAWDDHASR